MPSGSLFWISKNGTTCPQRTKPSSSRSRGVLAPGPYNVTFALAGILGVVPSEPIKPAAEAEAAMPVGTPQTRTIGPAVEVSKAMPITPAKSKTIGPAVEVDTAMPLVALGGAAAAGTVMMVAGLRTMIGPQPPETGYHLQHDHHDVIGGAIVFGLGAAIVFTTLRVMVDPKRLI
jgi:hypothetical protein